MCYLSISVVYACIFSILVVHVFSQFELYLCTFRFYKSYVIIQCCHREMLPLSILPSANLVHGVGNEQNCLQTFKDRSIRVHISTFRRFQGSYFKFQSIKSCHLISKFVRIYLTIDNFHKFL